MDTNHSFVSIAYLQSGNEIQRRAYRAISELGILADLAPYHPVLCGTVPIGIDVEGSDLDIVMEAYDFEGMKAEWTALYGTYDSYAMKEKTIRDVAAVKANFQYAGFEFELFAQPLRVHQQHAYRHMIIEHHLLAANPHIKAEVIRLKKQGVKTEPAFAQILGLEGDPYEALLLLGEQLGII
ncbi:DUF4269 domain-containing protein [Paenibacillus sp. H1-7]|uniref:DUF4269 domain-containing protein n=1 Tax=Paenibacillus sp. H1-7 TaxID=2282849 RepID=UPI001EF96AAD|nr:DUF4269 domain-containing protein [Paenibacillus sp. H1-7]ULL14497.1 DUF4269 domain-containing protein [Paenibacillus sp. H1-7]